MDGLGPEGAGGEDGFKFPVSCQNVKGFIEGQAVVGGKELGGESGLLTGAVEILHEPGGGIVQIRRGEKGQTAEVLLPDGVPEVPADGLPAQ